MVVGLTSKNINVNAEAVRFFSSSKAYGELSNFYTTRPYQFKDGHRQFRSMEQYFTKRKQEFLEPGNLDVSREIMYASAGQCKAIGRKLKYDPAWDDGASIAAMEEGLLLKFGASAVLRKLLVDTYPRRLIEENPRDEIWGAGANGNGKNQLGKLLAKVRKQFINGV